MNIENIGLILMIVPLIILLLYAIVVFIRIVIEDGFHKSPKFWIGLALVIIFITGFVMTVLQYEASK